MYAAKLTSSFPTMSIDRHVPVAVPTHFTPIAVVLRATAKNDDAWVADAERQMTFFAALRSTVWEMTEAMWMVDDGP